MRAYSEAYLDEVVENQGKLFDLVAHEYPMMNTVDFINTYMVSKTRKAIDASQAYVNTMDARTLWDYFTSTEEYSLKLAIVERRRVERARPFYIAKTLNVLMQPQYNLMVEFESGEKRVLNIKKYIEDHPEMYILKDNKDLCNSPKVSICGYQTAWEAKGLYLEFHNDYVYMYGRDVIGALGGNFPKWLGKFYAYYQWYYNIPSAEVIRRLPIKTMQRMYYDLCDYQLERAVQKVGCE